MQVSQRSSFAPVVADLLSSWHLLDVDPDFRWSSCVLNQLCTPRKFYKTVNIYLTHFNIGSLMRRTLEVPHLPSTYTHTHVTVCKTPELIKYHFY